MGAHTTSHEGKSIAHRGRSNGSFGATIYAWTTRTRLKLLEQDATPSIDAMVFFAQQFRALDTEHFVANRIAHLSTENNDPPGTPDMFTLVAAVKALHTEAYKGHTRCEIKMHNSNNKQDQCPPPEELPAMNVANEAIILELASTDRTLLEVLQIILVIFKRVRCNNFHRLGHVASNCFRPLNGRREPMQGQ